MKEHHVIDRQLACYNARDLEGFISFYDADIEGRLQESGELLFKGIEALKARYLLRFESVGLKATIINRMILGNKVVDFERIEGIEAGRISEVIVTYKIEGDKISQVWFLYP